jgi:hypothetical protein
VLPPSVPASSLSPPSNIEEPSNPVPSTSSTEPNPVPSGSNEPGPSTPRVVQDPPMVDVPIAGPDGIVIGSKQVEVL